jgi:hypothetical protein
MSVRLGSGDRLNARYRTERYLNPHRRSYYLFGGWLLIHTSDRRVLRLLRSPLNLKVSKAYREANAALVAVIIMIMGVMILGVGVVGLFGLTNR